MESGTLSSGRGAVVSQGKRTRHMCVRVRMCVCDTDGCTNGKTDRCLGGSNGERRRSGAHSRGEIASGNIVVLRTEVDVLALFGASGEESKRERSVWSDADARKLAGFNEKRFFVVVFSAIDRK